MNRIDEKFKELKKKSRKAFIAYVTCGDPDLKTTKEIIITLSKSGVDIIELGVPFSDPLADGPTIQVASERALKNKISLKDILKFAKHLRSSVDIPLVIMSYYNPIFHYGIRNFIGDLKRSGLDGIIIPDLPPQEASQIELFARKADLATIYFIAPTSQDVRIKKIINHSKGFIYYVSLTGVTGTRKSLPLEIKKDIKKIKTLTKKPICVGFGISNAVQAKEISKISDGIIIGSAIIEKINNAKSKKQMLEDIKSFASNIAKAVH